VSASPPPAPVAVARLETAPGVPARVVLGRPGSPALRVLDPVASTQVRHAGLVGPPVAAAVAAATGIEIGNRTVDRGGVSRAKALARAAASARSVRDLETSGQARAHAHGVPLATTVAAVGPRAAEPAGLVALVAAASAAALVAREGRVGRAATAAVRADRGMRVVAAMGRVAAADLGGLVRPVTTHGRTGGPGGPTQMDASRVATAGRVDRGAPAVAAVLVAVLAGPEPGTATPGTVAHAAGVGSGGLVP
jgi:hypothetical protein